MSNKKISGSSSFKDRATAEKVANITLLNNKDKIEKWLNNHDMKKPLVLSYKGSEVLGRGITKGSAEISDLTNAKIILKKNNDGSFILTGYPTR